MSAYFITGTGTDVGKTWLSCALLGFWRAQGRPVRAYKPVQSGFDPAQPSSSDAGILLQAQGLSPDRARLDAAAPWRFAAALAPDMAAAREGRAIDFAALVEFTRRVARADFWVPAGEDAGTCSTGKASAPILIEGVGGVMVPLDASHTVRDWMAAAALPAIVVAGSYLGSLSHTLTALAALREVGAGVTALAVNESPGSAVSLAETVTSLRQHAPAIAVVAITRENPSIGIATLAALL